MRDEDSDDTARPSKTQVKKAMLALQDLGQELLNLNPEQLEALPLDEAQREAVEDLRNTHARSAHKRQIKYLGKLLQDADVDALREALARARTGQVAASDRLHELEAWRERLLTEEGALASWIAAHPQSDNRSFRSLVERARRERDEAASGLRGQAPRKGSAYRELFKRLREA